MNLFKHQKEGVLFLLQKAKIKGKMLLMDQGTGKTRTAIVAADEYDGQKLVICPASLKLNWQQEIQMVYPNAKIYVVNSKEIDRRKLASEWVIINYDILAKYNAELYSRDWTVAILDESQYIKNETSTRSQALMGRKRGRKFLSVIDKIKNVWLLTGTPINRPKDFYNQLRIIGHPVANNGKWYLNRYCRGDKTPFGWTYNGAINLEELRHRIKDSVFRKTKSECLDLPEKIRQFIPVEVSLKDYHKFLADFIKEKKKTGQRIGPAQFSKLQQSVAILKTQHTIEYINSLLESDESVIIFTCFTEVVNILEKEYEGNCVKIVGGMTPEQKNESVKAFQSGSKKVFIGNIVAAGVGLTLTKARYVVFNDFSHTLTDHLQAEDRNYRIGQQNACTVVYFPVAGTVDDRVREILAQKVDSISVIMDGKSAKKSEYLNDLWELLEQ